jgi:hypothetical protein
MQIETIAQRFVPVESLLPTNTGTVTATVMDDLTVQLSGSGDGWSTHQQNLILAPETTPAYYRLTLELNPLPPFSLIGAQIFRQVLEEVNTGNAALFVPASSGQVQLNLFHHIEITPGVVYQLFLGIQDNSNQQIFWPDPTISFDPQG